MQDVQAVEDADCQASELGLIPQDSQAGGRQPDLASCPLKPTPNKDIKNQIFLLVEIDYIYLYCIYNFLELIAVRFEVRLNKEGKWNINLIIFIFGEEWSNVL